MSKESRTRKFRFFLSYQKELCYLEKMAMQGWLLENISVGVIYTFRKSAPVRMLYDVDRFNLPKKPTLEEIRHKEMFLEMAQEMGWKEITHDESLTYYFAKEYVEGDVNELHNDEASRAYRARKFSSHMRKQATIMMPFLALLSLMCLCYELMGQLTEMRGWLIFVLSYVSLFGFWCYFLLRFSVKTEKELTMSRQEWMENIDPETHKTVHKLILTARFLGRFLRKQAQEGWILTEVTALSYSFVRGTGEGQIYTMDTKGLVNKRRKKAGEKNLGDRKDWMGLNNDWELQSVKEAEEKGWTFVCALENRSIIYRGDPGQAEPLNDAKYDNSLRLISLIGEFGATIIACGVIGGICGMLWGWFAG